MQTLVSLLVVILTAASKSYVLNYVYIYSLSAYSVFIVVIFSTRWALWVVNVLTALKMVVLVS